MKTKKLYKVFFGIAALLVIVFCIKTGLDYHTCLNAYGSAPFGVYVLINAAEFILPSVIFVIVGFVMRSRQKGTYN